MSVSSIPSKELAGSLADEWRRLIVHNPQMQTLIPKKKAVPKWKK